MSARWRIVPVEPTAGMLGAGYKRVRAYDIYFPDMSGCLASIVEATNAAAPRASEDMDLVSAIAEILRTADTANADFSFETEARAVLAYLEGAQ